MFRWRVVQTSPAYLCLRVWAGNYPKVPWLQVRWRSDDPWLRFGVRQGTDNTSGKCRLFQHRPIGPGFVRAIIERVAAEADSLKVPLGYGHFEYDFNRDSIWPGTDAARLGPSQEGNYKSQALEQPHVAALSPIG